MELSSSAFEAEGDLPLQYAMPPFEVTFDGGGAFRCPGTAEGKQNLSPPLSWQYVPREAKSLALLMVDRMSYAYPDMPEDALFPHWVVYNIPPTLREFPEGLPADLSLPGGGVQGLNNYPSPYNQGYGGPCPMVGEEHFYVFTLYALDTEIDIEPGADFGRIMVAIQGHILAEVDLPVYYTAK